jgi:hypothetical protein
MTATRRKASARDYFVNTASNRFQSQSATTITLRIVRISDNLMLLDYDTDVTAISSQPFVLHWHDGIRERKHTPDYLSTAGKPGVTLRCPTPAGIGRACAVPG